ncbi:unnamed protein product [Fraxinus pennsylvanica]|uniref:Uncharacterized protein n=1 Tax=Fraxinus pennsylvanica TaxID=56036 RepID=A0AAD1YZF9_9LAMI|nr:unnamed protein product [Fraxinus pennsylvanica]
MDHRTTIVQKPTITELATDDFLEQILGFPTYGVADNNLVGNDAASLAGAPTSMMLQLGLDDGSKSGTEKAAADLCRAAPSHRPCLRVFVSNDLRRAMNSGLFMLVYGDWGNIEYE